MLKTRLVDATTGKDVATVGSPFGRVLLTISPHTANSFFNAETRATSGTTIVAQPTSGEAIVLTDLIISAEKVSLASVTVRFTDGTHTINIVVASIIDAPVNMAIPFAGRWMGWRDARIEMVTSHNGDATVSCGYAKLPSGSALSYAEWDAAR